MISVVIRVKNEMETLPRLIEALKKQTYQNFEIVVVDNESTDGSLEYAQKVTDIVVKIKNFTYSKASNLGVSTAKGEYCYFISGHCLPIHDGMLERGVELLEKYKDLAGVFGRNEWEAGRGNFVEKLYDKADIFWPKSFKIIASKYAPGILQTSTALIRTDLLKTNPFKETYIGGGEDALWAIERLKEGWKAAYDPSFDVWHSHGGSNWKSIQRYLGWYLMNAEVWIRGR